MKWSLVRNVKYSRPELVRLGHKTGIHSAADE